jgi:hypothetical protein
VTGEGAGRPSGLGRPLGDVLPHGDEATSRVAGLLGEGQGIDDDDVVAAVLELLRLSVPGDVAGVCTQHGSEAGVCRIAGPVRDEEMAWYVDGALRAVLRLGQAHVLGPPGAPVYALPMGRDRALAVHRPDGVLDDADQRKLLLLAQLNR